MWALEEVKESKIQDTNELQERNQALAAEVVDLKEGLDAIEERARDEMGMIKTDETFFQIIDNASLNTNNK